MSYYPTNFYSNYPYGNNQYQMPNYIPQTNQPQVSQIQTGLQGKIVDGEDIVKVTDVPMGGYGIFPKADFSEIYIKTWNQNGTTSIVTFQPVIKQEPQKEDYNVIILERIKALEEKIDALPQLQKQKYEVVQKETEKRKEF